MVPQKGVSVKTLLAPKPLTISINPEPETLNPEPQTLNRFGAGSGWFASS